MVSSSILNRNSRRKEGKLAQMPVFSGSNMGRKAGSLLGCSNWIFYQDKVFEVTLQRAVSLLQVYDHSEP